MPRKPKVEKHTITVVVKGAPIGVILHPPTGNRPSWYAYWNGLVTSKSTGQRTLEDAIVAAENMVKNEGRRASLGDAVLTDEEFEAIQRAHFAKKTDPAAKARTEKTLESCLEAIAAFKALTDLPHVAMATADDCASFQTAALKQPQNWRKKHPKSRKEVKGLSPNTVLKWSRSLQAAFERANRNAAKKKCIRGVVDEGKLLTSNPWTQFTWIGGTTRPIRHFDDDDLLSFLTFLETTWRGVPIAATAAKTFLWSCCRKLEVAALKWEQARLILEDGKTGHPRAVGILEWEQAVEKPRLKEAHFHVVGKMAVERWFRVPEILFQELLAHRKGSKFVFAVYTDQIRQVHADNPGCLKKIKDEFTAENFGRWFYERVKEWSEEHPNGRAYVHIFRKTALQLALDSEEDDEPSKRVADDAGVTEAVLLGHYAQPKLWRKSNRTYLRILDSLPSTVAERYGHVEDEQAKLERQIRAATAAQNWELVGALCVQLGKKKRPETG